MHISNPQDSGPLQRGNQDCGSISPCITREDMIVVTTELVTNLTWGQGYKSAGQGLLMSTHPFGSSSAVPPSEWRPSSHIYTRAQTTAALRAALIALVLLGILAVMILF
jgi:hypothetical protein